MNIGNASRKRPEYTLHMPSDRSLLRARRQCVPPCITDASVRSKVWLEVRGEFAIGEGGIELLTCIAHQGSLARGTALTPVAEQLVPWFDGVNEYQTDLTSAFSVRK